MKINLSGKKAIVSGSSAGIGWGCARGLAEAGATVVLTGRPQESLASARDRLLTAVQGATVLTVAADLSQASGCDALVAAEPACDILVNNLGFWEPSPFVDTSDTQWERSLQLNLMPGGRLARAYIAGMIGRGWGRVVFISSIDAITLPVDSLHYGVAKAAVLGLSRGLSKVAQGSGVTVNAILPGPTMVEWLETLVSQLAKQSGQTLQEAGDQAVKTRYPTSLSKRVHSVGEVANLVVYACSAQASATTGTALRADGGIVEAIV
jgi:NAD(P)-dependent dehydrogenase (short-subunit alcohol dehydrogenase family)